MPLFARLSPERKLPSARSSGKAEKIERWHLEAAGLSKLSDNSCLRQFLIVVDGASRRVNISVDPGSPASSTA
jgi:hypothetical protein